MLITLDLFLENGYKTTVLVFFVAV